MALVDYKNKVIYWDEVNWQWLPFVNARDSGNCSLVLRGVGSFPVECVEDASKILKGIGYCLSSLHDLGIFEVSKGAFLYKEGIYCLSSKSSMITLISNISGMSKPWVTKRISDKGVISKSLFNELAQGVTKLEYNGKVYSSYHALASDLGISSSYMYRGLSEGRTVEDVVKKHNLRCVTDHLGNKFNTQKAMLNYWGISEYSYRTRINKGWSLERALSTPSKTNRKVQEYSDFKGNIFSSATSLAKEYGVSTSTILKYLDMGRTSEEITYSLFQKSKKVSSIKDHLGNEFTTQSEMVEYYGLKLETFINRHRKGWSLEEALTGKRKKKNKSIK